MLGNVQQIYNKHDDKLIFFICLCVVLYLLSSIAKITWLIIPEPSSSGFGSPSPSQPVPSESREQPKTNLDMLLNLNLFGEIQEQQQIIEEDLTETPETKLNLILSGVVASSEEGKGAAVISYRNNQATYGIGDQIEGTQATLDQIYHDRVIIKNRAVRETLMLEGLDFEEANKQRLRQNEQNNIADRERVEPEPIAEVSKIREELKTKPESFTDFIIMQPERTEVGLIGFRLSPGNKYPELFQQLGLQNGDIAIELNGLDLSDLQQAAEAASVLQSEEELILEILRDGDPLSLVIEIPQE